MLFTRQYSFGVVGTLLLIVIALCVATTSATHAVGIQPHKWTSTILSGSYNNDLIGLAKSGNHYWFGTEDDEIVATDLRGTPLIAAAPYWMTKGAPCKNSRVGCGVSGVLNVPSNDTAGAKFFLWWGFSYFGAIDGTTGESIFNHSLNGAVNSVELVGDNLVLVNTVKDYGVNRTSGDQLYMVDLQTGKQLWDKWVPNDGSYMFTYDYANNSMIILVRTSNYKGSVAKYDLNTGEQYWIASTMSRPDLARVRLLGNGSFILSGNYGDMWTMSTDDGSVQYIFSPSDGTYKLLGSCIDDGYVYMYYNYDLMKFDLMTMKQVSVNSKNFRSAPSQDLWVRDNMLHFVTSSDTYALNTTDLSQVLWHAEDTMVLSQTAYMPSSDKSTSNNNNTKEYYYATTPRNYPTFLIDTKTGAPEMAFAYPKPSSGLNFPPLVVKSNSTSSSYTALSHDEFVFSTQDGIVFQSYGFGVQNPTFVTDDTNDVNAIAVTENKTFIGGSVKGSGPTGMNGTTMFSRDSLEIIPGQFTSQPGNMVNDLGPVQDIWIGENAGPNHDKKVVIVSTKTYNFGNSKYCMAAYDHEDLTKRLWKDCQDSNKFSAGIYMNNGIVYYGTFKTNTNVAKALDMWTGDVQWMEDLTLPSSGSFSSPAGLSLAPVSDGTHIYFAADCSLLYSLKLSTGAKEWETGINVPNVYVSTPSTPPVLHDDKIFICNRYVYIFNQAGKVQVGDDQCRGQVVVWKDNLYYDTMSGYNWMDVDSLMANPNGLDFLKTASFIDTPVISEEGLVLMSNGEDLYAAHQPSQTVRWKWTSNSDDIANYKIRDGYVFVNDDALRVLDLYTGVEVAIAGISYADNDFSSTDLKSFLFDEQNSVTRHTAFGNNYYVSLFLRFESSVTHTIKLELPVPVTPDFPPTVPSMPRTPSPQGGNTDNGGSSDGSGSGDGANGGGAGLNTEGSDEGHGGSHFFIVIFFLLPACVIPAIFFARYRRQRYAKLPNPEGGTTSSSNVVAQEAASDASSPLTKSADSVGASPVAMQGVAIQVASPLTDTQAFEDVYAEEYGEVQGKIKAHKAKAKNTVANSSVGKKMNMKGSNTDYRKV